MFRSNCLITCIIIRIRIGGKIQWTTKELSLSNPFGHFHVRKNNWLIDFCPYDNDLVWYKQLWFLGHIRARNVYRHRK